MSEVGSERLDQSVSGLAVKQRAGQAGRLLWGLLVGIATLGGVLGVYQFFSNDQTDIAPEAMVLRMVDTGDLSAEQAASLISLLGDDVTEAAASTLADGSDRQIEALQLVAATPTFERGIVMLEDEAETADDWRLIAELSRSRDADRAVAAARTALTLDPQDFDTLRLLIETQLFAGDFAEARRAHISLTAIAQSPLQRLKAAILEGDIAQISQNPDLASEAIKTLTAAIEALEPLEKLSYTSGASSLLNEALPVAAEGLATRATQYFIRNELDRVEPDYLRAISLLEPIVGELEGRSERLVRSRLAQYHDMRASLKHRMGELDNHHEAHEKAIAQYRAMADTGNLSAQEALPVRLLNLSREYYILGEPELAGSRINEARDRFDRYAAQFPDDNAGLIRQSRDIDVWTKTIAGDIERVQEIYLKTLSELEADLLREGDPDRLAELTATVRDSVGVLYRYNDREAISLTVFHAPAMQAVRAFERRYGQSPQTQIERFNLRALYAATLTAIDPESSEAEAMMRELLDDMVAQRDAMPATFRATVNRLELYALSYLSNRDTGDALDLAQRGLQRASELDASGELTTSDQPYLNQFERRIAALNGADGPDE